MLRHDRGMLLHPPQCVSAIQTLDKLPHSDRFCHQPRHEIPHQVGTQQAEKALTGHSNSHSYAMTVTHGLTCQHANDAAWVAVTS